MHDMRLSGEELKDFCTPKIEAPRYPMGLCLTIDKEQYEKFSFQSIPQVDETYMVLAKAKIVSVDSPDGKPSLRLQIMEMELKSDKKAPSAEKVIYGE